MAEVIDQVNLSNLFNECGNDENTNVNLMEVANEYEGDHKVVVDQPTVCETTEHSAEKETTGPQAMEVEVVSEVVNAPPPPAAPASQGVAPFKKGSRVLYSNPATGVSEEMEVVGVHYDDFPNIYYTVQSLAVGEDGLKRERQTTAARLTLLAEPEPKPEPPKKEKQPQMAAAAAQKKAAASKNNNGKRSTSSPVTVSKDHERDTESDGDTASTSSRSSSCPEEEVGAPAPAAAASQSESQSRKRSNSNNTNSGAASAGGAQRIPIKIVNSNKSTAASTQQQQQKPPQQQPQQQPRSQPQPQPQPQHQHQQRSRYRSSSDLDDQDNDDDDDADTTFPLVVNILGLSRYPQRPLAITVTPTTTVSELMAYLARCVGVPVSMLRLVVRNRIVSNGKWTMDQLGLAEGSRVTVEVANCGGAGSSWYW